jgi:hypothetical protein
LPFICWDLVETIAWYIFAVETKGRTRRSCCHPHPYCILHKLTCAVEELDEVS